MRTPIDNDSWRAEARRLRARGHDADAIAVLLHQGPSAVREALRGTPRPRVFGAGANLVETHVARVPRVILDRTGLRAAFAAFASGEIDRAELMKRISVSRG